MLSSNRMKPPIHHHSVEGHLDSRFMAADEQLKSAALRSSRIRLNSSALAMSRTTADDSSFSTPPAPGFLRPSLSSMVSSTAMEENESTTRRRPRRLGDMDIDFDENSLLWTINCSFEESNDSKILCPFPTRFGLCGWEEEDLVNNWATMPAITTSSSILDRMVIPFDYEVYYTQVEDPPLDFLQGFLLHHLAQALDLPNCSSPETRRTTRRMEEVEEEGDPPSSFKVLAIASEPADVEASREICQSPVEKGIQDVAECSKIRGQVMVYVDRKTNMLVGSDVLSHAEELAITSQILKEIRSIMIQDKLVIATPSGSSVERVVFLGEREPESTVPMQSNNLSQEDPQSSLDSSSGSLSLASELGIAFSVILALSFVMMYFALMKRRRRKQNAETGSYEMDGRNSNLNKPAVFTLEHCAVPPIDMEVTWPHQINTGSSSTDDSPANVEPQQEDTNVECIQETDEPPITPGATCTQQDEDDLPTSMMVAVNTSQSDGEDSFSNWDEDEEDWSIHSDRTEGEVVFYAVKEVAEQPLNPDVLLSTPTRTLAFLSEPAPMTTWVHDDEEYNGV